MSIFVALPELSFQPPNRDRREPRGSRPPTPPDVRVTSPAVRWRQGRGQSSHRLGRPRAAPCGPSTRPRGRAADLWPRLSAVGDRTSLAGVGPPRPSADVCRPLRPERSARRPVPPGHLADLPGSAPARAAPRRRLDHAHPLRRADVAGTCPVVPGGPTSPLRCLGVAPRLGMGLPPDPPSRGTPWPCASPAAPRRPGARTCPALVRCHAWHTRGELSGAVYRVRSSARLWENSIFQKCVSTESTVYDVKNANIWGFHTVWRWVRLRL